MKCKECEKYWKTADPENGVCSLPESFFPTKADDECHYLKDKHVTCKDCQRWDNDTACMTAGKDDPADDCPGFIDLTEAAIQSAMMDLLCKGRYSREMMMDLIESFEGSEEYKFLSAKRGEK